jgi:hypothetical protein
MIPGRILALAGLLTSAAVAADMVGVPGTSEQYVTVRESQIGDRTYKLFLTGAALRQKVVFHVYTIGSYLQEGAGLKTAEQLASADMPKQLHLIMQRDVDGKDLAGAFRDAVRMNYPAPAFDRELAMLTDYMKTLSIKKGEHFWLTHVPGTGLYGGPAGKNGLFIRNPAFSKAVWEIYLGRNNLGDSIKQGLTSRL